MAAIPIHHTAQQTTDKQAPTFDTVKIYIADFSFEFFLKPEQIVKSITEGIDTPKIELTFNVASKKLFQEEKVLFKPDSPLWEKDFYTVELNLIIHATDNNSQALFHIEIKQAGIFNIQGLEPQQLDAVLNGVCPNILYPYACAQVTDKISQTYLSSFYLKPIDFTAAYAQYQAQQEKLQN
jgi:protein-export chaperone SecB